LEVLGTAKAVAKEIHNCFGLFRPYRALPGAS
jgi:hypothetical protein